MIKNLLQEAYNSRNKILIEYFIRNTDNYDNINFSTLCWASYNNNLNLVKYLVEEKKINVNEKEKNLDYLNYNTYPLFSACYNRFYDNMKYLIENGADINLRNGFNKTFLEICCSNVFFDGIKLLVENNVNIDKDSFSCAIRNGNFDIVKYLIKNGADVNGLNEKIDSPLVIACIYRNYEIADLLIKSGANISSVKPEDIKNDKKLIELFRKESYSIVETSDAVILTLNTDKRLFIEYKKI